MPCGAVYAVKVSELEGTAVTLALPYRPGAHGVQRMPAVVSVECWPFGHASHDGALVARENCPAAHGAQRPCDGSSALATNVPGVHGCVASQNGWPGFSWNVFAGHGVHIPALVVLEKLPAAHGAHRAGDGSLTLATNVPGVHCCVASQNGWPEFTWNVLTGQSVQLGAFTESLYLLGVHGLQTRSLPAVGAAVSYEPFWHCCTARHDVCPSADWYCPAAQPTHVVLPLAFWIWPAAHRSQ